MLSLPGRSTSCYNQAVADYNRLIIELHRYTRNNLSAFTAVSRLRQQASAAARVCSFMSKTRRLVLFFPMATSLSLPPVAAVAPLPPLRDVLMCSFKGLRQGTSKARAGSAWVRHRGQCGRREYKTANCWSLEGVMGYTMSDHVLFHWPFSYLIY